MQINVFPTLVCLFLASCGGSEPTSTSTRIPLPDTPDSVEPSVSALLQRTVADIRAEPTNPKLWAMHASALFANDYMEPSVASFRIALDINPEMPQARYINATALWRLNRQGEAITELNRVLEQIPEYGPGWRLLAQWRLDRGESQQAQRAADRAFKLNERQIGTRFILSQAYLDLDRPDEAIQLLEQAMDKGIAPPWLYKVAATCYRQLGMNSKMESALELAGPPPDSWPDPMFHYISDLIVGKSSLTKFALWTFNAKGPVEALPRLIKAMKINPEHVDLRAALSVALQESGKLPESLQVLEELQGEPNANYWRQYASACLSMAEVADGESWVSQAASNIQHALELEPNYSTTHDLAAKIASRQGRHAEAADHWGQAGKLHIDAGEWQLAEVSFSYALEIEPTQSDLLRGLARAQIENGRFASARVTIDTLLQRDPMDAEVLEIQRLLPSEPQR